MGSTEMKTLFSALTNDLPGLAARHGDAQVSGIASDSRLVKPGALFID